MLDGLPEEVVEEVGGAVPHRMYTHHPLQAAAASPEGRDLEDQRVGSKCTAHSLVCRLTAGGKVRFPWEQLGHGVGRSEAVKFIFPAHL